MKLYCDYANGFANLGSQSEIVTNFMANQALCVAVNLAGGHGATLDQTETAIWENSFVRRISVTCSP